MQAQTGVKFNHKPSGKISGAISNLRCVLDAEDLNLSHFGFVVDGLALHISVSRGDDLPIANGDRIWVKYQNFTAIKIINLSQNQKWGAGALRRWLTSAVRFFAGVIVHISLGVALIYASTYLSSWVGGVVFIVGLLLILGAFSR